MIRGSKDLQAHSRSLRDEISAIHEQIVGERHRAAIERTRNQGFGVDFFKLEDRRPELSPILGSTGFLALLGMDAQREFRSLMCRKSYPPGTVLFRQGELPHTIWFVFGGEVKLAVDSGDGRRFILRIARPGELMGLAAAFASCAEQVTAEVSAHCDVGSARSVEFMQFLEKYPEAFRAAAQEMGRAYNQTCMRLRIMGVNFRVTARLAGLLLEWAESGNESERGIQIPVGLTHEEIGQCIGTTRETVSRVLHELENRKVIEVQGSRLTILGREALEECTGGSAEES